MVTPTSRRSRERPRGAVAGAFFLRTDGRVEAGKVAKSAERKARGPLKTFAIMARAEVMLADDQPKIAAEYLA